MNIEDFLPKYSNIDNSDINELNLYDNFYDSIFKKKEFYENRLSEDDAFPKQKGTLTKYQKTVTRFLSSNTPYDKLFLIHDMGYGKCVLPNTKININNTIMTIEDIWKNYSINKIAENNDTNSFWADCNKEFLEFGFLLIFSLFYVLNYSK